MKSSKPGVPWRALILLAVIALSACGGSDSGSDLRVRASVAGEDVAAGPVMDGAAQALTLAHDAVLDIDAAAAVSVSADSSVATVETVSPTRHLVRFASPGGATVVLTVISQADGGSARLTVSVQPQRFENRFRRAGQVLTYRLQYLGPDGELESEYTETEVIGTVAANGDYSILVSNDNTPESGYLYTAFYDADGNDLGYDEFIWQTVDGERYDDGNSCTTTWAGADLAFPLYVGKRWTATPDNGCRGMMTVLNEVLGYEVIQTAAGPVAALLRRRTPPDLPHLAETCWWSVQTGLNLRCTRSWRESDGAGVRELGSIVRDLLSIDG